MPRNMVEALEEGGYMPFFAAGVRVSEDGVPEMRLDGEMSIVRKLEDDVWQMIRDTLVNGLDDLRASPLDDLEVKRYDE